MSKSIPVIHVRLKPGVDLTSGNIYIDRDDFVVTPFVGDFFAVYSDFHYSKKKQAGLIRIIHKSNFIVISVS
ncbi:hypothetical protein ES705_45939 [subsurface metagenome]